MANDASDFDGERSSRASKHSGGTELDAVAAGDRGPESVRWERRGGPAREADLDDGEDDELESLHERLDERPIDSRAPGNFGPEPVGSASRLLRVAGPDAGAEASRPVLATPAPDVARSRPATRRGRGLWWTYIGLTSACFLLGDALIDAMAAAPTLGRPARWAIVALQHPVRTPLALLMILYALRPATPGPEQRSS